MEENPEKEENPKEENLKEENQKEKEKENLNVNKFIFKEYFDLLS